MIGAPKRLLKALLRGVSLSAAFPPALASGLGRWKVPFEVFAHAFALVPGIPGDYLRIAYYKWTLAECSLASRVSFGSFFAHSNSRLGPGVYIGSYCIIGMAAIGERTQIASGVQILSGARQHFRNEKGEISGAAAGSFSTVAIGADCWIGASAIVMADVGARTTIGAGSVVTRPIPPSSVAVGSPARVISGSAG
jgi:virginiamycin A acetyltransferase